MDTGKLKKFAQEARIQLMAQVAAKLDLVLAEGSAARREAPSAVKELLGEIAQTDRQQVIEKTAYTWFNRFTALRFMDANGLTNPRVVTPAEGQTRPELLADAGAGHMDDGIPEATRNAVAALLDGRTPSRDAQGEAYRLLLVAACNHWHGHMPFMFEKIRDFTELLMPEDLLSQDSILSRLRAVMADEDCQDVEIIGWLYQFYISEKKDQVFAALKKNVKISAENIPAATQLFTPHWIVRYLVENSLGRLWLLNRPQSSLAARMDYYIAPEEPETDFLRVAKPEDIRICDPACGSGHILTYAFDLLHAIYEEEGYDAAEIPALILTHNLHGIEIDHRAGAMASFALSMKAAAKLGRRRFLRLEARPNICVLQDVRFTASEMQDVMAVVGRDLFTAELQDTLGQFEEAKNFGSLIVPKLRDPAEVARVVRLKDFGGDLLLREVQERVLTVLEMAEALSPKYHVVVANPPYMGGGGMNPKLKKFVGENYPAGKSDLMTSFMERLPILLHHGGTWGMINIPTWMFRSTFERLRTSILEKQCITSLLHLGRGVFGSDFGTVAFCLRSSKPSAEDIGIFRRLFTEHVQVRKPEEIEELFLRKEFGRYSLRQLDLAKLPGSPIVYWASKQIWRLFDEESSLDNQIEAREGLTTGSNETFMRYWHEPMLASIGFGLSDNASAKSSEKRWFPYVKGGEFRRWYGNLFHVVNWWNDGQDLRAFTDSSTGRVRSHNYNDDYGFRLGLSWSNVTSGNFSVRYTEPGFMFDTTGPMGFTKDGSSPIPQTAYLNSCISSHLLKMLSPTLDFKIGHILNLPIGDHRVETAQNNAQAAISLSKLDWDAQETSWNFTELPLLSAEHHVKTLADSYAKLRAHWQGMTDEMQRLEEENNRIFIETYGLQCELTPEVPLDEITLTCNPTYRYGGNSSIEDLEERLRADTIAEFLHYAVGCLFGRYSIDAPGIILANQGEGLADYLARVPNPRFEIDADNVIPLLEGDWFADDITERFRKFLRITFGEERFQENLAFIEDALGKDIRKWFTKDFFDYHVRRYKKRPIYWLFSSPKGSFNALIYMHRYRPDTVSVLLNDYLREFISKLQAERLRLEKLSDDVSVSQSQRTRALKEVGAVARQIDELTEWERDVIFPLAQAKIEIDLDDGVKANYPKFGAALKPIKGLDAKEDE